jgi:mono/diheme cytochrome c family protein
MRLTTTLTIALAACMLAGLERPAGAQDSTAAAVSPPTTAGGVYAPQQADRGKDVYASLCTGCHTPDSHTGQQFIGSWIGHQLVELFRYISESMPKDNPGALSPQEYVDVTSYILKLNRMPAGQSELPADTTVLSKIRIDTTKTPDR